MLIKTSFRSNMNSFSASEPYLYLQVNLKPFGETGDCECYWEQNAQEVSTRQQETGFPYKTPKLPGLIMNKVSTVARFRYRPTVDRKTTPGESRGCSRDL